MLKAIAQRRCRSSTALKWPLKETEKVSQNLLAIESHWKGKLDAEAKKSWSKKQHQHKKYVLSMFPYPSGNLHMGHMRVYTISDLTAKYYMLNGYNVIHPMGWDAFGLPAENAARDRGVDPREWTKINIAVMREQLLRTGVHFDWSKEISTCDPEFYRWTQWIFLKLYEKGLIKRVLAEVNWDPVDQTVLAAEQIDSEGRSWRSGAIAEKKKLRQWMVETPKYAKRLSDGLKKLEQWFEAVDIQSNWIGICDAYRFQFPLRDSNQNSMEEILDLRVLDPIAISKASFIVLKQGHPLSDSKQKNDDEPYILPISALNGVTGCWMPLIVVPTTYEGPQMFLNARVGDDTSDHLLVSKFKLAPQKKIMPMTFNDVQEIAAFGGYGGYLTSRTLQDWIVSRQRTWGTPIPMVLSEDGKHYAPLQESSLPLLQGKEKKRFECAQLPQGYGYNDMDTLDTFFDSSWYYLRFLDPHNETKPISKENATNMPVDIYVGGVEHAAVHMFFARFISYFLTDIGVTSIAEPFKHLITQGIVRGKTYVDPATGKYLRNDEVTIDDGKPKSKDGIELDVVYEKMSKSKHNGVDPLQVLDRDGVDLTRLQILSAAAPRQFINWGEDDLKGLRKWLDRVAWIVNTFIEQKQANKVGNIDSKLEAELTEAYNLFVRNVGMHVEVLNLHNTGLMKLIAFTNVLRKIKPENMGSSPAAQRCVVALLTMIQVYAPHASNEMWSAVQNVLPEHKDTSLADMLWPQFDEGSDIDFILSIDNVSCGRVAIARNTIEDLDDQQLILKSLDQEHRQFIDRLRSKGADIQNLRVTRREGFHVTIHASLVGAETYVVGKVLDELQSEYSANKKAKRKAAKA